MKKLLQKIALVALAVPGFAIAQSNTQTTTVDKVQAAQGPTTAQVMVQNDSTTVISPRTGIRYTLGTTGTRPIVLKTAAIAAVNSANANRIVASNPALSVTSQEKAKQALLATNTQPATN